MSNRIIKESICTSQTLSNISIGANLLFHRLTTKADDHGCFDARTKIIRGGIFPLMMERVSENDIDDWLLELQAVDCIRMWVHTDNNVRFGLFPNFSDHQIVRSLHKRKTPIPPEAILNNKTSISTTDNNCKQVNSGECLNPNPNPNPNPKHIKPIVQKGKSELIARKNFDLLWETLPNEMKKGKEKAFLKFKSQVKSSEDWINIQTALVNYIADVKSIQANGHPDRQFQNGATWFNHNWKDYINLEVKEELSLGERAKIIKQQRQEAWDANP